MFLDDQVQALVLASSGLTVESVDALAEYVQSIQPTATRHEGWNGIAQLRNTLGDTDGEFAAWQEAYGCVADLQLFNWGWHRVLWWWSTRDQLSKKQKAFVLEVAQRTAEVSERLSEEDPGYYDPALFLTRRLQIHAMAAYMNRDKPLANSLMERCVKLAPGSPEYRARSAAYAKGEADGYFNAYSDYDAAWSPDGRRVLFTSTRDRNPRTLRC